MDCFDSDFYQTHELRSFSLEFLGEMHWGDEVELMSGKEGSSFHIQAVNLQTGKIAFKADVEWGTRF